jgi:hypothetical protein
MSNYSQPFFVGYPDEPGITHFTAANGRKGKFVGVSANGYLPALEEKPEAEIPVVPPYPMPPRDDFAQLQGRVNWLQGRLDTHLDNSKKRKGFRTYE